MSAFQEAFDYSRGKTSRTDLVARKQAYDEANRPLLMPDQEELQRAHRRKLAKRKGGRSSTILSTSADDRLGP